MLHAVEVLPSARRSMRHGVKLECELFAREWEGARRHRILDLSPDGLRIAAAGLLPVDAPVIVSFTPPGWWLHGELTLLARVARAEPRGKEVAAMGLSFLDLSPGLERELFDVLRRVPPPIPKVRPRLRRELVWIDVLVTYEEDLGDRVNVFEVSEQLGLVEDAEIAPRALAALLTSGARAA